jgi:UDP-glucose 4-epimerase
MVKNILITCIGCAPASAIARSLNNEYNIIGIDLQDECVGTFICEKYISLKHKFGTNEYWNAITDIIVNENIVGVFVTAPHETYEWSKNKSLYMEKYSCEIYLNDSKFIAITNDKTNTYEFCINNNINIPKTKTVLDRPIVIKPCEGCGSRGIQILNNNNDIVTDYDETKNIIQEFIQGDEYTVDVISNKNGEIINIIPKKRLLVKNGQSFKSIIELDELVIDFVKDVCLKLQNKSAINVQVIKQYNTNEIFLIEINPRFATTINLSIEGGVHIPKILIEHDFKEYPINNNLLMVRDYKEYFINTIEPLKKIFITGGAGFIGSKLVEKLCKQNFDITIFDNLSTVNCGIKNIEPFLNYYNVHYVNGDILNKEQLNQEIKNHDIVIHLAAQLEITSAYKNQIYDLEINLIGTINVINACIKNKIKRLINASSACVYGFTDGNSSSETDDTNPNWEYGATKLAAEKYLQIAQNTHNICGTSLRFSIVYGENEWYGRVLPIFVKRALENKNLIIFGDGNQKRDYIHVNDVVNFICECIENKNTHNKIYNVSNNKGISINDLASKIISHFPNLQIEYDDVKEGEVSSKVEGRERLNQELKYLILDNTKALTETNWKPSIDFDNSLYSYINWAKNIHKDYWRSFKA